MPDLLATILTKVGIAVLELLAAHVVQLLFRAAVARTTATPAVAAA